MIKGIIFVLLLLIKSISKEKYATQIDFRDERSYKENG